MTKQQQLAREIFHIAKWSIKMNEAWKLAGESILNNMTKQQQVAREIFHIAKWSIKMNEAWKLAGESIWCK